MQSDIFQEGQNVGMSVIGTRENIQVLSSLQYNGVRADILEYQKLLGLRNIHSAATMWFMKEQNIKVRQIAFYINNDAVKIQAGAMSYFQGPLQMVSGVTMGNAIGKMFKASVTGETMSQPIYQGSGILVSEPSFRHFIPFTLNPGEQVIVDKGMFYAASNTVQVEPVMQRSISSGLLGGEGWFQIGLTGPGLVVLECDVPMSEINVINLNNDTLKVDGNFAVLRTGNLDFTVERAAQTLVGSAVSGEGLVNVFRGTGQVWLAPTLKVYSMIDYGGDVRKMDANNVKG